jgi:hypothetical protein
MPCLSNSLITNYVKTFFKVLRPDIRSDDPCSDPSSSVRQKTEWKIVSQLGEAMTENVFPESKDKKDLEIEPK